jgi:hypothetical protein
MLSCQPIYITVINYDCKRFIASAIAFSISSGLLFNVLERGLDYKTFNNKYLLRAVIRSSALHSLTLV